MISRRDFLKVAGVGALAVATAGLMTGCSGVSRPNYVAPIEGDSFEKVYADENGKLASFNYGTTNPVSLKGGKDQMSVVVKNIRNYEGTGYTFIAVKVAQKNYKVGVGAGNFKVYAGGKVYDALNLKSSFSYVSFMEHAVDAVLPGHAAVGASSFGKNEDVVCFLCPDNEIVATATAEVKFIYSWENDDGVAQFDTLKVSAREIAE